MAITIKVEPQDFQSAFNEVITVLDSTNKAEPKFQYVIDININGVYSSRLKVQSNPQGFGVVNLAKHLESYVSSNLDLLDKEAFKQITDSYVKYDITLAEEYVLTTSFTSVTDNGGFCQYNYATSHNFSDEDFITVSGSSVPAYDGVQEVTSVPSATAIVTTEVFSATATGNTVLSNGTVTVIADPVVFSSDKYVTNNVLNWVDVPNWDSTDYDIDSASNGDMLTNVVDEMTTRLDDRFTFNFYNAALSGEATHLQVTNSNGNTFFFDNINPVAGVDSIFLSVGVGAFDILNAPPSAAVPVPTAPVIDLDTVSYTVKLVDAGFNQSSKEYTFYIDRTCTDYEGYRLMYLNKGGSYSTFNFNLVDAKNISVNKTNFKQNYGSYNSVANSYGWNSSDRGEKRLDTDITETYNINSNYVSSTYGDMIEDLIVSPEVYHLADNTLLDEASKSIVNITSNGGFAEIQTSLLHNYNSGDKVVLAGIGSADYNGEFMITSIVSPSNFIINKVVVSLPLMGGGETVSRQVFGTDGVLRAIDITTDSVRIKQRKVEKLINYTLSFRYSNKNIVQR